MKTKIIIALVASGFLFSCNKSDNSAGQNEHDEHDAHSAEGRVALTEQQANALDLQLGTLQMRNMTTVVKTNGQLEVPPAASAEVSAIIGGNVKEIKVFHGDKVRKGQVLAILEHPDYISLQEDFAGIASQLEFLAQEFNRQKVLYDNNVGAGRDFQQIKAEYNTAKAKYAGLKSRLQLLHLAPERVKNGDISNTITITSPINGYINDVDIEVGTYADAKEKLFGITDNSKIHADFMVYENDVHLIKEGQIIDFTVSNRPGEELTATIFAIGKEFEPNTRAVHIHAKLADEPNNLIPGMYVSGHIHTDKTYNPALPNDAVVTEGTESYIFVLDELGDRGVHENQESVHNHVEETSGGQEHGDENHTMTFRKVEVVTGKTDEGYTEVKLLDSLPENTQVVLNAAYYLLADLNKEETEHAH